MKNDINNSFNKAIDTLSKEYNDILRENRVLRNIIQKLEADKLNDERVRELTEKINWMNSYGFFLTKEDIEEVKKAKNEFKKENPNKKYDIIKQEGKTYWIREKGWDNY